MCADYLHKLSARKPVVCKALIAANGKIFNGSLKNKIVISSFKNDICKFRYGVLTLCKH